MFRLRNDHKEIMELKRDGNARKREAWEEIARIYNASPIMSTGERTMEQLRKCYMHMMIAQSKKGKAKNGDDYQDTQSEISEACTFITDNNPSAVCETLHLEQAPDGSVFVVPPPRKSTRKRAPRANTGATDFIDIDALLADLPHDTDDSIAIARREHRRKLQMMEDEHIAAMNAYKIDEDAHRVALEANKLNLEKAKWEVRLARGRYEREFNLPSTVPRNIPNGDN